jgi:hypothetical protein
MDSENDRHQPEEYIMGMTRGEHMYVPQQGAYREDPGVAIGEGAYREDPGVAIGEGAGREGAREDEREEDVSSFLNPSGDGMEIDMFDDEGQTNTNDERQLQTNTDGEVYRFSFW